MNFSLLDLVLAVEFEKCGMTEALVAVGWLIGG